MREQMIFYFVFLSQVLLISSYLPRAILSRVRYVVETYPPSKYPKLYPVPIEAVEKAQRNYKNMNLFALLVGFVLLFIGAYSPTEEMLNWDSISVITIYFLVQHSPMMIAATSGFTYFNLMRRADSRTTRKAELHPRRLFYFVSPVIIGVAIFVYVAFVSFIIYVRQFDFSWFGGYWNIFGITALNLLLVGIIVQNLYGKKKDPYQTYEDRVRHIELTVNILVFSSIMGTVYVAIAIGLHALDFQDLMPISLSLYMQLVAIIGFRAFRIDGINFEVYKETPAVA